MGRQTESVEENEKKKKDREEGKRLNWKKF